MAKVPEMMQAGVNVGIGCDGGPSNNSYDMIREMKTASLLQKVRTMDPLALCAETVLEMVTINGAKVLGLQDQIGSLETGKKADLIMVNMHKPHLTPTFNPVSHLFYAAEGSDVETTIIDGKIIMENRIVKTLNEEKIIRDANEHASKLLERAEIDITSKWTAE
jgi:cytosine/adenosine deaminase-related metal-dependent hydrolase